MSNTASCRVVDLPGASRAVLVGALVATLVTLRLKIDNVAGAFPVYSAARIRGTLCVALFGHSAKWGTGLGYIDPFLIQLSDVVAQPASNDS